MEDKGMQDKGAQSEFNLLNFCLNKEGYGPSYPANVYWKESFI